MCFINEKRNNNQSKSTQAGHHRVVNIKSRKSHQYRRNNFPRPVYRKVFPRSASDPYIELRRREEKNLLEDYAKKKLSKEEVVKRAKKAVTHLPSIIANLSKISSRIVDTARAAATAAAAATQADKTLESTKLLYVTLAAVDAAQRGAATARRRARMAANISQIRASMKSSNTRKSLRTAALEDALADAVNMARFAELFAEKSAKLAEIIAISASAAIAATVASVSANDAEKTAQIVYRNAGIANQKAVEIADRAYQFARRFLKSMNSFLERRTQMPPPSLPQISAPNQQYQQRQSQCSPTHDSQLFFPTFSWANRIYSPETISRIHTEICERIDSLKSKVLSDLEKNEIKGKIESIRTIVSEKFTLEIYGSYRTGLCTPNSDLDLCLEVESDPSYSIWKLNGERTRIMRLLKKHFKNEAWVLDTKHPVKIINAKHPVLKFTGVLNNMKKVQIDITVEFKKMNGHPSDPCLAADLILQYKEQFPALEPMTLIVKHFFHEWGLNDTFHGCPNSYCIVLMIATFLRHAYNAYSGSGGATNPKVGEFLLDFFNFYGNHFKYRKMGIRYDYKEKYHYLAYLNDERSSRFRRKTSKWGENMVIDDPIVEENNVGSAVTQFPRVKKAFQDALANLKILIEHSRVHNIINKSYLKVFLKKDISLQRHTPIQSSSSYNVHIPRQYSDQRAHRFFQEGIPVHFQSGYYVPHFLQETDHTFFQPQILSTGLYY